MAFWREKMSHLPQPKSMTDAEIMMHRARTETESLPLRPRAYSHAWLCERGLPSGLPDNLKQSAERLYPSAAKTVGISGNYHGEWLRPAVEEVRGAMEYAVEEAFADGHEDDSTLVKKRMFEAKERTERQLFGR